VNLQTYISRGLKLIPLQPKTKLPFPFGSWKDAAIDDLDTITKAYATEPTLNLGVATGERSGVFVLDVDGDIGKENLDELVRHHGLLPETPEVLTGGGGRQLYFRYPSNRKITNKRGNLPPKIDVRGEGGYVVAPPSIHPNGNGYAWELTAHIDDHDFAEAPEWLLDMIDPPQISQEEIRPTPAPSSLSCSPCTDVIKLAATRYLAKCEPANQGLFGDTKTLNVCGHVLSFRCKHGFSLTIDEAVKVLDAWNQKCSPPWSFSELRQKMQNSSKYGTPRKTKEVDCEYGKPKETPAPINELPDFVRPDQLKNTKWLWKHHIPLGSMTLISGEQGHGKSTMLYDLIARITAGRPMPDGQEVEKGQVLIASCEDSAEDSAGPKLVAAGAHLPDIKRWPKQFTAESFPELERWLKKMPEIKVVMIEPIYEVVKGDTNGITNVTIPLGTLQDIANRCAVAIIGVHHFGKGKADNANQKTLGSMGFTAKPRANWGVVKKKDDPTVRIFAPGKCNVKLSTQSLQFRIEDANFTSVNGELIETAKIVWLDERLEMSLDQLLAETSGVKSADQAKAWLKEYLAGSSCDSVEIFNAGKDAGYTRDQLYTAKDKLKVKPRKQGIGAGSKWIWELPQTQNYTPEEDQPF